MGQKRDTIVQFSGLKSGRYTYDFTLGGDFFDEYKNEEIAGGEVRFDVTLDKKERTLLFNFHFEGTLVTMCDRCLGQMTVPVKGDDTLCVKFSDEEQSDNEDVAILPENASEIDLAQYMYEYVAVSLPMQHVHAEGECDPSVTSYITDSEQPDSGDETDPRWDALLKIKEENKNN